MSYLTAAAFVFLEPEAEAVAEAVAESVGEAEEVGGGVSFAAFALKAVIFWSCVGLTASTAPCWH